MINTMIKRPMKYGLLNEGIGIAGKIPNCRLKASEVFYAQGGKFVSRDTSAGYFDLSIAADTQIIGWAEVPSSYAGAKYTQAGVYTVDASIAEYVDVICDINARFLMGCTGTPTTAMKSETCDIEISSSVQKVNEDASSTDVLVIYDINATLSLVEVGLNPAKMYTLGTA